MFDSFKMFVLMVLGRTLCPLRALLFVVQFVVIIFTIFVLSIPLSSIHFMLTGIVALYLARGFIVYVNLFHMTKISTASGQELNDLRQISIYFCRITFYRH